MRQNDDNDSKHTDDKQEGEKENLREMARCGTANRIEMARKKPTRPNPRDRGHRPTSPPKLPSAEKG